MARLMIMPGLYEVSNIDGKVRNVKTGRLLKPRKVKGYCMVSLSKHGKKEQFYVHRLVATAFIPNPNGYSDVNHLDEDKTNNSVDNLEWLPHKENVNHGTCQQRHAETIRGKKHSEETKQRMSEARKGKQLSEEHKKKLSEAWKGKPKSEETRRKMSEARKGKPKTEEHKKKISEACKGKKKKKVKKGCIKY